MEGSELKMWRVHVLNIFLVGFALLVNLLRGSPKTPSIIGVKRCGGIDFTLLFGFIAVNLIITNWMVVNEKRKQELKEKHNKGVVSGTIKYEG